MNKNLLAMGLMFFSLIVGISEYNNTKYKCRP